MLLIIMLLLPASVEYFAWGMDSRDDGEDPELPPDASLNPSLRPITHTNFEIAALLKTPDGAASSLPPFVKRTKEMLIKMYLRGKFKHRQMEMIIAGLQMFYNELHQASGLASSKLGLDSKWYRQLQDRYPSIPVFNTVHCPNCKLAAPISDDSPPQAPTCSSCDSLLYSDYGNARELVSRIPLKAYLDVAMQNHVFRHYIDNPIIPSQCASAPPNASRFPDASDHDLLSSLKILSNL